MVSDSMCSINIKFGVEIMPKVSREEIKSQIEEENVKFLRLMFTDILGVLKNVEVPINQIDKVLDGEMMFDGSSIEGFVRVSESDMYLKPDLDTWLIFPWEVSTTKPSRVARLICDVYTANEEPFIGDPRGNLKRVLNEAKEMGFTEFNLGPEPEFFLFKLNEAGEVTADTNDHGDYFDLAPLDSAENCRRDIVLELQELGFSIEASHHELGPGLHEIDWQYADAVEACDNIQTFKLIVKTVARRYGLHASFMAKPSEDLAGAGMHMNLSLFKDGKNAFYDPEDEDLELSKTAYHFLAGLTKHAKGYTAITNPTVNSYKRMVPGYEAPMHIAWADNNRTPMLRVPSSKGQSTRIEVRSVDPTANPYLSLAVLLKAGLNGIKNELTNPEPKNDNVFEMSEETREAEGIDYLPLSLKEALAELENDEVIKDGLGNHIYSKFTELKQHEWLAYSRSVSEWEKKEYLRTY